MRNMTSREQGAQEKEGLPSRHWRALRACEDRIQALHNLPVTAEGKDARTIRLRGEAEAAVQLAGVCAQTGAFRKAHPAALAGMVNRFARLRRPPVEHQIDDILAFAQREVAARAQPGVLRYQVSGF